MKQLKKEFKSIIIIYMLTWVLCFLFIVFLILLKSDNTAIEAVKWFFDLLSDTSFLITLHLFFLIVFGLYLITRYFIRVYKNKGVQRFFKQIVFRLISPVIILVFSYNLVVFSNTNEAFNYQWDDSVENTLGKSKDLYTLDGKHRGMHVFGFGTDSESDISEVLKTNVEWVAVVPFFYQKNERTKQTTTPKVLGKWTKKDSSFINVIAQLHSKNMHVMLKPHLWLSEGWRSNINFSTQTDWEIWFESYRKNILHYAKLAELTSVELLCIGTELKSSIQQLPNAWLDLIKDIKKVYSGKLTYAANWDDDNESYLFWNELDYIGIQAYFPLTKNKRPDLETINAGWNTHLNKLEALSKTYNKPILFTEIGYKSEISATVTPWEWDSFFSNLFRKKSDETQQLAYEALFQQLWHKDWFAGLYIWQWSTTSKKEDTSQDLDFSPRFKPAENTIAKWFKVVAY